MDYTTEIKKHIKQFDEDINEAKAKRQNAEEKRDDAEKRNDDSKYERYNQEVIRLTGVINNLNDLLKILFSKLPSCKLKLLNFQN